MILIIWTRNKETAFLLSLSKKTFYFHPCHDVINMLRVQENMNDFCLLLFANCITASIVVLKCTFMKSLSEYTDDLSIIEFVSLPKFLIGLSGVIAGYWNLKLSNTLCLVDLVVWCFVIMELIVIIRIVKLALDIFLILSLGLLDVSYIFHGTILLFHRVFFSFGGLNVLLSLIYDVVVFMLFYLMR